MKYDDTQWQDDDRKYTDRDATTRRNNAVIHVGPSRRAKLRTYIWNWVLVADDENTKIFLYDTLTLAVYVKPKAILNRGKPQNGTFTKKKKLLSKEKIAMSYYGVYGDSLYIRVRSTVRTTVANVLVMSWKKE